MIILIVFSMMILAFCRYMESFDSLGEFVDLDLLDHLEGAMLMNKKLLFLGVFYGTCIVYSYTRHVTLCVP